MTQPEPQFGRSDDELAAMPLTFRDGLFDGQVALVSGSGRPYERNPPVCR